MNWMYNKQQADVVSLRASEKYVGGLRRRIDRRPWPLHKQLNMPVSTYVDKLQLAYLGPMFL